MSYSNIRNNENCWSLLYAYDVRMHMMIPGGKKVDNDENCHFEKSGVEVWG